MRPWNHGRRWPLLLVLIILLGACTDPQVTAEEERFQACQEELDALAAAIDDLAASYGRLTTEDYLSGVAPSSAQPAEQAIDRTIATIRALGCAPEQVAAQLEVAPTGRAATDPIAARVARQLRSSVTGTPLEDASLVTVTTEDDLARVVAAAPEGSVLELAAGEHHTTDVVRVQRSLTIRGTGRDQTTVRSQAEGVALVAGPGVELELTDLTIEHTGSSTVGVLQLDTERFLLRQVRVTGGTRGDDDIGGAGILVGNRGVGPPTVGGRGLVGVSAVLLDVEVVDNQGPGVLLSGTAAPRIVRATVADNGVCGVCYLDAAAGTVTDSDVRGSDVGVLVSGTAAPVVTDTLVADNRVDGILIEERARGRYADNRVHGNGERGILVTDDAAPVVIDNDVRAPGELGIAVTARARPTLTGNRVEGHTYGIWAEGDVEVELVGNQVTATEEIAIVLRDAARAVGSGNSCLDNPFDLALFDTSQAELTDSGCDVVDER